MYKGYCSNYAYLGQFIFSLLILFPFLGRNCVVIHKLQRTTFFCNRESKSNLQKLIQTQDQFDGERGLFGLPKTCGWVQGKIPLKVKQTPLDNLSIRNTKYFAIQCFFKFENHILRLYVL